jgi:hypothetical protein
VLDGHEGEFATAAGQKTSVASGEVGVLAGRDRNGDLTKDSLEPGGTGSVWPVVLWPADSWLPGQIPAQDPRRGGNGPWRAVRHTPGTALIGEDRDGGRHVAADRVTRDREAGSVDALRRTVPHERL